MDIKKIKIGTVELSSNVFLAPMAGVTDLVFRVLCKEQGAGLVYSEMVSAKGMLYESKNTDKLLTTDATEHPVAAQLFGSDPAILADIAKKIEPYPFDIIDINMGCPAPKITKNGEGSALMKTPALIGEIVSKVSRATHKPVTIKIRKGFNENTINAVEIAKIAEQNGAAAITIHGRTREQYYSGHADWDIIRQIKESVRIPVIGNGDVQDELDAKKMLEETHCDAVMVGRASEGNPWIFKKINHYLQTGQRLQDPTVDERIQLALRHMDMLVLYKGEYTGVREMRRHLGFYIKGLPNCAATRVALNKCSTADEMKEHLLRYTLS